MTCDARYGERNFASTLGSTVYENGNEDAKLANRVEDFKKVASNAGSVSPSSSRSVNSESNKFTFKGELPKRTKDVD